MSDIAVFGPVAMLLAVFGLAFFNMLMARKEAAFWKKDSKEWRRIAGEWEAQCGRMQNNFNELKRAFDERNG